MLHDEAAHIKDELYNTFKTWVLGQCTKFFNASGCILEFMIKWTTISTIIIQGATKEKVTLPTVFKEYEDIFTEKTPTKLPSSQPYDHTIELKDSFIPQWAKAYLLNSIEYQACKQFIKEHLKTGKISPSKSPQATPFFFIKKKKARKLCPCQEYRYLNSHMVKNTYPLPLISDLIDKLQGSSIFTKFDVWWRYNDILIKSEDQWKAAFTTPLGLFESNVMFFGMCNSPATFQAFMDDLFGDYIAEGWLVIYMDGLLIHFLNQELHNKHTQKVLQWFQEQEMYLKLEKCMFSAEEVEYLGMIVGKEGIQMDPIKLKAIWEWSPSANVKVVRFFLGFCNFY